MAAVNARAEQYKASGAFDDTPMDVLRAHAYLDLINGDQPPSGSRWRNSKTTTRKDGQPPTREQDTTPGPPPATPTTRTIRPASALAAPRATAAPAP